MSLSPAPCIPLLLFFFFMDAVSYPRTYYPPNPSQPSTVLSGKTLRHTT